MLGAGKSVDKRGKTGYNGGRIEQDAVISVAGGSRSSYNLIIGALNKETRKGVWFMADQFYMTREGYEAAKKELEYLQTVKRKEIVDRIAEARSHGDLSENAEYDAARNEQAANEGEIVELEYKVKNAVIIEESDDNSVVHIGSTVTVWDEDLGEEVTYTIMGTTEVDPMNNVISNESPVGAALLRHKKGEEVFVKAPGGEYKLVIRKID